MTRRQDGFIPVFLSMHLETELRVQMVGNHEPARPRGNTLYVKITAHPIGHPNDAYFRTELCIQPIGCPSRSATCVQPF